MKRISRKQLKKTLHDHVSNYLVNRALQQALENKDPVIQEKLNHAVAQYVSVILELLDDDVKEREIL